MRKIIFPIWFLLVMLFSNVSLADERAETPKTISAATLYEVMTVLPVAVADRDDPRKQDQLYTIAVAIERAIPQTKWPQNDLAALAAYFVTIGYHESRFRLKIHEGVKRAHSYGVWQVTPHAYKVKRTDLIGLTQYETDHTAVIVGRAISTSWNCGSSPADHFTAYYGGVPCKKDWRTLKERVSTFWYVRAMIVQFEKERGR